MACSICGAQGHNRSTCYRRYGGLTKRGCLGLLVLLALGALFVHVTAGYQATTPAPTSSALAKPAPPPTRAKPPASVRLGL